MRRDVKPGDRFGRLVVTAEAPSVNWKRYFQVRCDCGTEKPSVSASNLWYGHTTSCGCWRVQNIVERSSRHGMSLTRAYRVWHNMRVRVGSEKSPAFPSYGGRGIDIDPRWDDFAVFHADMGNPPTDRHSIERKDNMKGYSQDNCCWATAAEQTRNMRSNVRLTVSGETMVLVDACKRVGVTKEALYYRMKVYGHSHQQALDHFVRRRGVKHG